MSHGWFHVPAVFITHGRELLTGVILLAIAVGVALVVHAIVFAALRRISRRPGHVLDESIIRHGSKPAKWIFIFTALLVTVPTTPLPHIFATGISHVSALGLIAAVAWIFIAATAVMSDLLSARYRVDVADNLSARKIETQVHVLRRVTTVIVVIVAVAMGLMTLPGIKTLGASMLASAGLAGLVVGMAMRPTLANLVAGIQIALTQPIRLEDAVIVAGEWGWIEEITATYVVIRIWDWRRLVVPLAYFIEQPFQNWTHQSADLLGSVHLNVDWTVPVDRLRDKLTEIVHASERWDGKVVVLQVVEATGPTVQLRALVSAKNSGIAWDLRCEVREKLIAFLQAEYPHALPKQRTEITGNLSRDYAEGVFRGPRAEQPQPAQLRERAEEPASD